MKIQKSLTRFGPKHVKSRQAGGATLHYIEGWQVIAEANRIFGFDGWDRETLSSNCVWMGCNHGEHTIAYTAKVRITVRVSKTDADLPSRVRSIHGPTPRLDLRKLNTSWAAAGQAGGCRCALRQAHGEWRRLHCAKN